MRNMQTEHVFIDLDDRCKMHCVFVYCCLQRCNPKSISIFGVNLFSSRRRRARPQLVVDVLAQLVFLLDRGL
jgi:hypothetical protein